MAKSFHHFGERLQASGVLGCHLSDGSERTRTYENSSSVDVLWDRTMPRFLVRNAGPQSQDSGCTASLPPQPLLRAQGPGNASGDRDRAVVSGQRPPDAHPKPGRPGPSWVEFVGAFSPHVGEPRADCRFPDTHHKPWKLCDGRKNASALRFAHFSHGNSAAEKSACRGDRLASVSGIPPTSSEKILPRSSPMLCQ